MYKRQAQHSGRILRAASCAERVLTFGKTPEADIYGHDITVENGKVTFTVSCDRFEQQFTLAMHGIFNVENALAAIAAAYAAGIGAEEMKQGLEQVTVDGRMEEYTSRDRNVKAIVDYAHNGLSFETVSYTHLDCNHIFPLGFSVAIADAQKPHGLGVHVSGQLLHSSVDRGVLPHFGDNAKIFFQFLVQGLCYTDNAEGLMVFNSIIQFFCSFNSNFKSDGGKRFYGCSFFSYV